MLRLLALVSICSLAAPALADPCGATELKLGKAKPLAAWTPPAECTATGARAPVLLATETDARAAVSCKDPKKSLGVDFTKSALVLTARSWSPAMIGLLAFDDGKTVTLVSKQRNPCPGERAPMPTPTIASVFLVTAGARTFAEVSCTAVTKCK